MRRLFSTLLALSGIAIAACAVPQQLERIEQEQRRLRGEYLSVASENTAIQRELHSIRSDLAEIRSSLADTRANVDQIQQGLSTLREKIDEVRYQADRQLGAAAREGNHKARELQARLARMEDNFKAREEELKALRETLARVEASAAKQVKASEVAEDATQLAREKVPMPSEAVKRDYEEAMKVLELKDYRSAISRLREFIKRHPQSEYADNAQYWIGESYYALKEFEQAIIEFDEVERKYPNGDKVPAALLKQGFAFAELGSKDVRFKVDARLILQKLIERYPKSEEAGMARQRLKALES